MRLQKEFKISTTVLVKECQSAGLKRETAPDDLTPGLQREKAHTLSKTKSTTELRLENEMKEEEAV